MKLFENGVGRPTNEILRKRKIFIASVVAAIALLLTIGGVLLFGSLSTNRLQGAAASGTGYINLKVKNGAISASGCNITIPYQIENRSRQKINVYYAKLTTSDNKTLASATVSDSVPAGIGKTKTVYIKFNSKYLPTSGKIRTVIYFKANGKEYFHTEYVTPNSAAYEKIKTCKGTSQNGNSYVNLHVTDSKIYTNTNCQLVVPARVINKSNQKITITDAKITSQWTTSTVFATSKKTGTIAAGKNKETTVNFAFPVTGSAFPRAEQEFKIVVYYQVNGKGRYYIVDQIDTPNAAEESIKHCKDRDGNSYINHHVSNDVISVDSNCNLVVKPKVENRSNQKITVVSAKLTSNNNKTTYVTANASGDTVVSNKNAAIYTTFKFSQSGAKNAIAKEGSTMRMVTYFKVNSYATSYWITEKITIPSAVKTKLNSCKTGNSNNNNNNKTIKLTCTKAYLNKDFNCYTNVAGSTIKVSSTKYLANGYKGQLVTKTANDKLKLKYTSTGTIKVTASKSGYQSASVNVVVNKVTNAKNPAKPTLTLNCPVSAKTNQAFKCTTNQTGVKLTVGGANSLASGYSSSYTTKTGDLNKDIKYTDALFSNYATIIKTDANGEYINAKVTATKSGYTTTTKYVKIYKSSNGTPVPEEPVIDDEPVEDDDPISPTQPVTTPKLTLTCPTSKKIGDAFNCTTNQVGVTITVGGAKSLASGYSSKFITTSDDKIKEIKYDGKLFKDYASIIKKDSKGKEYINATVTATKSGYGSIKKVVKIYKKPLTISCDSKVEVGKGATCYVTTSGKAISGANVQTATGSISTITKVSGSDNKYSVKFNNNLYTKYKKQIKKDKNKKEYIKAKVTATLTGYEDAKDYILVYKPTKTATKTVVDNERDILYYSIPKVIKEDEFGLKTLEFKINKVGKDVKKVKFIVCNIKEQCFNYNPNDNNPTTGLKDAKVGNVYKLKIVTPYKELLDQRFFVRMINYDSNGKEIYFKTHEFYTNKKTSNSSINENTSNEADVTTGDFTSTTHEFIISEHSIKDRKKGQLTYSLPSIAKLDNNGKKQVNAYIRQWGAEVKYVTFVVCNEKDDCNKDDNTIDHISKNSSKGTVIKDVEVAGAKKVEIPYNSKTSDLLEQKVYIRIYTYDVNKNTLYTMFHEFITSDETKLKKKKESDIEIGDRILIEQKLISQKYFIK